MHSIPKRELLFPRVAFRSPPAPLRPPVGPALSRERRAGNASVARELDSAPLDAALSRWWSAVHAGAMQLGLNRSEQKKGSGRSSAWKRKCRRFGVGARHDYQGSIRSALLTLGMCETSSDHWDFYWGEQWLDFEPFASGRIKRGALLMSIPGFRESFGDKIAFARLHANCLEEQARTRVIAKVDLFCDWTKRGFNIERRMGALNGPFEELREHASGMAKSHRDGRAFPQLWILKPQQSFNQLGISMVFLTESDVATDQALDRWVHAALSVDGWWTLQEYVQRPLLYRGRKFDLRVWAVL